MRLSEVLDEEAIKLCIKASTKEEVLNELVAQAIHETRTTREAILKRLLEREALGSTGIGAGVAVPHAVIDGLTKPKAVLAILHQPLDFDATDDLPVDVLFLLLTPRHCMSDNLRILQSFCKIVRDPGFLIGLRRARSTANVLGILSGVKKVRDQQHH